MVVFILIKKDFVEVGKDICRIKLRKESEVVSLKIIKGQGKICLVFNGNEWKCKEFFFLMLVVGFKFGCDLFGCECIERKGIGSISDGF